MDPETPRILISLYIINAVWMVLEGLLTPYPPKQNINYINVDGVRRPSHPIQIAVWTVSEGDFDFGEYSDSGA